MNNKMCINTTLSKTFDWIRFPLAVLVVYIHIDAIPQDSFLALSSGTMGTAEVCRKLTMIGVMDTIARVAVPAFFLMSGYLFFANMSSFTVDAYLNKLRKRVHSLLYPYLLWNLLAVAYCLLMVYSGIAPNVNGIDQAYNGHWLRWFFITPASYPLWFMRDLIIMSVCSPIIYLLVKKCILRVSH